MKKSIIENKPLQDVLDYLATRPYKEVTSLIINVMNSTKELDKELSGEFSRGYNIGAKEGYDNGFNDGKAVAEDEAKMKELDLYEKESKAAEDLPF